MAPLVAAALKIGAWWIKVRPIRRWRARRQARLQLKQEMIMDKQVLQGGLTYSGLAVTAVSYLLDKFALVPDGYTSVTVAGVLVGLAVAVYGRVRRESRPSA